MGLDSYYRRIIEEFSKCAYQITSLQTKDTKFHWNEKCEISSQKLKQLLPTTPILKIANPFGDYVVCTYAWVWIVTIEGLLKSFQRVLII